MHKSLFILNTDQVNKHGSCFSISAMEDILWEKSTQGVPMHLGHDMHRPIGCMIPFGLYFEPKLVKNIGIALLPQNDDETKQILDFKKYETFSHIKKSIESNNGALQELLKDNLSEEFKYIDCGTLAINDIGIVGKVFRELTGMKVKDDLLPVKDLLKHFDYKFHGVFCHKILPLCIYAHSFFRRSLSRHNNFHYKFLDEFMSFKDNDDITLKISIDWDMVGYAPTLLPTMEFDYWHGPKYTDEIENIAPGLTRHYTTDFEKSYYDLSVTEFYWKINEQLREFELEELRESTAPTQDDFYGCRYLHSIYDTNQNTFVHFDGAIRGYDSELYFERIDQKMTEFGRRSQYKKLFRMDGKIALNDWKSLVTRYMQSNPLIYEYFHAEKPQSALDKENKDLSLIEELVPHAFNSGQGIKLLLSYHKKNEDFKQHTHAVSIFDIVNNGNGDQSAVEEDVIEVKKALLRLGKELFITDDVLYGNFKDQYWNIPCIFHSAEEPREDIKFTIQALKSIFERLIQRKLDTVISFTIAWNIDEKEARLSCFGPVADLMKWLNTFSHIPTDRTSLKSWLEGQRAYINTNYHQYIEQPSLRDICQYDGILYIKRKMIDARFQPKPTVNEIGLQCSLTMPNDGKDYSDIINSTIAPVMGYLIKKAKCSKSNSNYYESPYSKFLDDDVHVIIEDLDGLNFYWSDKPVY